MKAVVLLCLLYAPCFETQDQEFLWPTAEDTGIIEVDVNVNRGCESNRPVCGCCLMQREIQRFQKLFNHTMEEMYKELLFSQRSLKNLTKAQRSIFSVALSNTYPLLCFGPFSDEMNIPYSYVLVNMGGSYNMDAHTFTVPCSGVYSLSVTLYGHHSTENTWPICAQLKVNDEVVASLPKTNGKDDRDDSSTEVIAVKLMTGDQVAVVLPAGCVVCDDIRHMTVFTGFLLYATD